MDSNLPSRNAQTLILKILQKTEYGKKEKKKKESQKTV